MANAHPTIFVLWGEHFDEAAAVLVITSLRAAGLRVKVVGLGGRCVKGMHGLGLLADLTLDQALAQADQARCVVIPCTPQRFQRARDDPRVGEFLNRTVGAGARFVVGLRDSRDVDIPTSSLPTNQLVC